LNNIRLSRSIYLSYSGRRDDRASAAKLSEIPTDVYLPSYSVVIVLVLAAGSVTVPV
jgi:hypothetical protein